MDRETLVQAISDGPVRVYMNDGRTYEIPGPEFAIVDITAAHILVKDDAGKFRARILSLVCMAQVERIESAA